MKRLSILSAILAALRENLDGLVAFTEVDMNLAILPIHFLFNAHSPMTHVKRMLDASSLHPGLPPHFDSQLRLNGAEYPLSRCFARPSRQEPAPNGLNSVYGSREVVLDFKH